MKKLKLIIFISTISIVSLAIADEIPIEDYSAPASAQAPAQQQSLSLDQQVVRVNQQMQNLTQMNLPAKIDALQQQVQQLQGALDNERHQIQLLQNALLTKKQPVATTPPVSNIAGNSELQEYQNAFKLLRDKNYTNAVTAMQGYLKDYPDGKYAVNAHYWLGEMYYLQSQLPKATNEFQTVIDHYPNSAKVPDAMLKLAMIYSAKGDYKDSHQMFQEIKTRYPNSAAARLMEQQHKVAMN